MRLHWTRQPLELAEAETGPDVSSPRRVLRRGVVRRVGRAAGLSGVVVFGVLAGTALPGLGCERGGVSSGQLVEFQRTGGFAGVHDTLTVADDGEFRISVSRHGSTSGRLTEADLDQLRRVLEAAEFGRMPARRIDEGLRDGFLDRISYQRWTVVTNVPGEVRGLPPVLEHVLALLDRYGPSR